MTPEEALAAIRQADESILTAASDYQEALKDYTQEVEGAYEAAERHLDLLTGTADEASDSLDGLAVDLRTKIDELGSLVREVTAEKVVAPLSALTDSSVADVAAQREKLIDEISAQAESLITGLLTLVRQTLDSIANQLHREFEAFEREIAGDSEASGVSRLASARVSEAVRGAMNEAIHEVDRVRDLASSVGISI